MNKSVKKILKNPALLFLTFGHKEWLNWMPDSLYLKIAYWVKMHKVLHLEKPKTFNEKLQWIKIHDRNPLYTQLVDKESVKAYVAERIGQQYVIPTLGVWSHFDDIDFSKLPNQFVLKCTHDSGGLMICKDKSKIDPGKKKALFERCLKHSFYWAMREWPYLNVPPRIIAEQYLEDEKSNDLKDYKFFCFNGEPKVLLVASDRQGDNTETKFDFFDMNYNHLPFRKGHPNAQNPPDRPCCFEEMKLLATKLSQGIPHVRVDLYEVNGKVFFGELTFFSGSGMSAFDPETWDIAFGEWLKLPID